MKTTEQTQEPILVKNPYTGKFINIQPLLDFVNESYCDNFYGLAKSCERAVKHVSLNIEDNHPPLQHKNVLSLLFDLIEVFHCMKDVDIRERDK